MTGYKTPAFGRTRIFLLAILLIGLLGGSPVWAVGDGEHGTLLNLSYGAGARAIGMGRAYVAVVNDPTAIFWNPAGLERIPRATFTLFHHQLFESTTYDFLGFAYPTLTYGTIGLGLARLGTTGIPITDRNNVNLGTSDYQELELYAAYSKRLPLHLIAGATFKVRRQEFTFENRVASGLGMDIGLQYQPGWQGGIGQNLVLGITYRNLISPELKLGSEVESEPYILSAGLSKLFTFGGSGGFRVALDYVKSRYGSADIHLGGEYLFRELGSLRAGLDDSRFSFGAGLKIAFVNIDYSFGSTTAESEFPPTHRFSLTFELGKSRQELIRIAEEKRLEREKQLVERTKAEERQKFIEDRIKKGQEYLDQQKYFDAYVEFQQAVSVDPFNETANALLQTANEKIQEDLETRQQAAIEEAVDKELAEATRNFVNLHLEKGRAFLQKNQFTDALIEFNMALERDPENPVIQDAISTTRRLMDEEIRGLLERGRAEFRSGNYADALRVLSQALVLSPRDTVLKEEINSLANRIKIQQYIQEAMQSFDRGEYETALALFEEALKMDPGNRRLQEYIERTKRGLGVVEKKLDQEAETEYLRGVDYYLAGRYEKALEIWRELAKKYPYSKKIQESIRSAEDRIKRIQKQP
ncbi:MAG: hypothetical protein Kow0037_11660 [Calditrichia bacterium]